MEFHSNISINITSNDTEDFSDETKTRFYNRNKSSSKCVSKQKPDKPQKSPLRVTILDKLASSLNKSSKPKNKFNSKLNLLSPLSLSKNHITNVSVIKNPTTSFKLESEANKSSSIRKPNTHKKSDIVFNVPDEKHFDKLITDCLQKGCEFEETFDKLVSSNLLLETNSKKNSDDNVKNNENSINKTYNLNINSKVYNNYDVDNVKNEVNNYNNTKTYDLKSSQNSLVGKKDEANIITSDKKVNFSKFSSISKTTTNPISKISDKNSFSNANTINIFDEINFSNNDEMKEDADYSNFDSLNNSIEFNQSSIPDNNCKPGLSEPFKLNYQNFQETETQIEECNDTNHRDYLKKSTHTKNEYCNMSEKDRLSSSDKETKDNSSDTNKYSEERKVKFHREN